MAKLNSNAAKTATLDIKDGIHHFTISRYKEFITKNDDTGIAIGFDLSDRDGNQGKASDLFIINDKQQHRLMRLLEACGLERLWDKGEITQADLVGQTGYCDIAIVANEDKKTKLQFPYEVKVSYYYINGELEFDSMPLDSEVSDEVIADGVFADTSQSVEAIKE